MVCVQILGLLEGYFTELGSELYYDLLWHLVFTVLGVFLLLSKIDMWIILWALLMPQLIKGTKLSLLV